MVSKCRIVLKKHPVSRANNGVRHDFNTGTYYLDWRGTEKICPHTTNPKIIANNNFDSLHTPPPPPAPL